MSDEIKILKEQLEEALDEIFDLVIHGCHLEDGKIDTQCSGTYEYACDFLVKHNILEKIDRRFYKKRKQEAL